MFPLERGSGMGVADNGLETESERADLRPSILERAEFYNRTFQRLDMA